MPDLPAPLPPVTASHRAVILSAAAIVLAAAAAYHNSFTDPFVFDDPVAVVSNPSIRHFASALHPPAGGGTVTGRPVLNLSFAVNYAISGTKVWSYHALNLLIHVLAGLTLFGVMRRMLLGWSALQSPPKLSEGGSPTRLPGDGTAQRVGDNALHPTLTALAIALIWSVHPLQTESVTYIAQRAESLMGLFYLLTLFCFIRYADVGRDAKAWRLPLRSGSRHAFVGGCWAVLSFLACLLGMATKEVMVSAPVMVLLYDRTFVSGSFREAGRRHRRLYLGLAMTWLPLAYLVAAARGRNGTAGFGIGVSWGRYLLTQFPAIVHYLTLSVWPRPLVFDYGAQWVQRPWDVLPAAVAVGVLAVGTGAALFCSPAKSGGFGGRALGFAGAWFFAILAPTSLVPGLRQTMAEHRMYLALVPVVVLAVMGLAAGVRRAIAVAAGLPSPPSRQRCGDCSVAVRAQRTKAGHAESKGERTVRLCLNTMSLIPAQRLMSLCLIALVVLITAGLAQLTVLRNETYRSDLTLWGDTVTKVPDNPFARNNFGLALSDDGRLPEAVAQYREALRIDPNLAEVHNNLGIALIDTQRLPEAIAQLDQALRLKPSYAQAHNDLGIALAEIGRLPEAIAQFEQALQIKPDYAEADNGLGTALGRLGRPSEAIFHFQEALRLKPDDAEAENGLGIISADAGRLPEAVGHYEQALRLDPNYADAHNNLGDILAKLGRPDEAESQFEAALRRTPNDPKVRANLGKILAQMGRLPEAAAQYEQALRLDPGNAAAHFGFGNMLAQAGRVQPAMEQYAEALRRQPDFAEAHNNLGNALARLGRVPDALVHFREAVRLEPENAGFHANFGNALAQSGRTAEAIAQYEDALRINPKLSPVRALLFRLRTTTPVAP